jgi:RNA polymerase sigma factor (sigma-70 family)
MVFGRDPSDQRFAHFCRTGDPDALGDVFDRTAGRLMRIALWLAGNRADAEDLLQRTFLQAIETRQQFRAGEPVLPWLMGLLGNQARKLRSERDRAAALRRQPDRVADPEVDAAARELDDAVRAVRERLGEPYGEVLRLHLEQGLNAKEIAAQLLRPAGTVRTQLMRALDLLRRKLPGGFVAGLAVLAVVDASALAAVRTAVLATAKSVAPALAAGGSATVAVGGAIMAKKLIAASCVLLLGGALVWMAQQPASPAAPAARDAAGAAVAASAASRAVGTRDAEGAAATGKPVDDAARVALPTTATFLVQGRAVRLRDAQPLPGARIHAQAFAGTEAKGTPVVDVHLAAGGDGAFRWPLEPPTAITCLHLVGEGERVSSWPQTFVVAPEDPPPPAFDLWIVPLEVVARGRVLDPQDRPIAGARVGRSWNDGMTPRVAATDAEGRFEVQVERSAEATLTASAHGFVQLRQQIDTSRGDCEVALHLRAANRIHGRVFDADHQPVAGATVRTFYTIYADGAETDADGRFVLDNLDPGLTSHSLFARKAGYVEGKAEVQASGPDVEQDLVLGRGVEVRGAVFGPHGRPVPAATVYLGSSPNAYDRLDAVTAGDGSFAFDCVAAGEQMLNVERRGLAGKRVKVQVPKAPAAPVVVRVDLDAGHFVGGTARDAGGKPLAEVSIAPRLLDEYVADVRGKTDADGRFRLEGLPAAGLSLEFYGKGLIRKQAPVEAVDRDDLAVLLEHAGSLAGTVVDGRTGRPIPQFRIRFGQPRLAAGESTCGGYSAQWLRGGKPFRDEHGVFRIDEELTIGAVFALEASADGYAASVDDHVVVAREPDPARTVIALYPGVAIRGVVRERDSGAPIAGAVLKAFASGRPLQPYEPNDDEGRPIATSDANGAFVLDNVGAGEIRIAVTHKDWLPATHGPIAVTPGGAVPLQEIRLARGATVTVDLRNADGVPMPDADLLLSCSDSKQRTACTDATGTARLEGVPPGDAELILTEAQGDVHVWTFRRPLHVEGEDLRVEWIAKDGDAALTVVLDAPSTLPEHLQILVMPKTPVPGATFRVRGATVQPGRTTIAWLPAGELHVLVMGAQDWGGSAFVTAVAGQTIEVHVPVQRVEPRRR